jgi:hypothetical protein
MTIDEEIARHERAQKDAASRVSYHRAAMEESSREEGEQANLVARLLARKAEAAKTVGQRMAEGMFVDNGDTWTLRLSDPGWGGVFRTTGSMTVTAMKKNIADAIDKAIADDRAAVPEIIAEYVKVEREACAKLAESAADYADIGTACCRCQNQIAKAIRARSK